MVTGTGRKPDVPRSPAQMVQFDGEKKVSLVDWSWKNLQPTWVSAKKTAFLLRLVKDPARSKWPALTSSYEGSNSGYAIKPKKNSKMTSRHQNTVEYITGKSFLFISLKEKLHLTLLSVRRSQHFISNTKLQHQHIQQKGHTPLMVSKLLYTLSS